MNGIPITVVGTLTADPELRFTQNGIPVANFTIANNERVRDPQSGEWKDGDATFLRTAAWRELGEHAAASLTKGMQVVATGKLKQRSYQDAKTQEPRTAYELELEDLAVSLRFGTTQFTKSAPKGQASQAPAQVAPQGAAHPVNLVQAQPHAPGYQPQGHPAPQGYPAQQPAQPVQQPQAYPQAPGYQPAAPQAPAQPAYAGAAVAGAQAASDDIF